MMKIKTILVILLMVFIDCLIVADGAASSIYTVAYKDIQPPTNKISLLGNMELLLPNNLKRLSDSEIAKETPLRYQRPTCVFEDRVNNIKFSINYGSTPAKDENLPQIKAYFEKLYTSVASNFVSSELKTINHKRFVVMKFEMLEKTRNDKVFNYLFMNILNGKLLISNYVFPSEQRPFQERQAMLVLNSIKIKN